MTGQGLLVLRNRSKSPITKMGRGSSFCGYEDRQWGLGSSSFRLRRWKMSSLFFGAQTRTTSFHLQIEDCVEDCSSIFEGRSPTSPKSLLSRSSPPKMEEPPSLIITPKIDEPPTSIFNLLSSPQRTKDPSMLDLRLRRSVRRSNRRWGGEGFFEDWGDSSNMGALRTWRGILRHNLQSEDRR